ncbi:MAG: type VII secretion protein EssC [Lachnospiraceae bacterium]
MSTVLSVYTKNAYKEFLLPAANNTDFDIVISGRFFQLMDDVSLRLESVNGNWHIKQSRDYTLVREGKDPYRYLSANDIIGITTAGKESVTIVVTQTDYVFTVMNKYDISQIKQITIGSAADNQICYSFLNLVSRKHAVLRKSGNDWILDDTSSNGIFINEKKIGSQTVLKLGDSIDIFGLKIIFLNDQIAVSTVNNTMQISSQILPLHYVETFSISEQDTQLKQKPRVYFHRPPRNVVPLETEPIEIEAPPAARQIKRKPLFMIIGPSFTMAIPMLLGTLLAMYSTRMNGGGGTFMYTGIITAIGSATLGVFWALMNIRYEKQTTTEEERLRFEAYGAYLMRQVEMIKEKYEKSRTRLLEQYPDSSQCVQYSTRKGALWSRNRSHEDFLRHRIGIGNLPFQIPITVPKERFSLTDDELMQKPSVIKKEYEMLYEVPVCADMLEHTLIGMVGGKGKQGSIDMMHTLSAQIAANNSYIDIKLIYIYDGSKKAEDWEFARWLPHVWSEDKKTRYVASNKEEASEVFYELVKIFRMRSEEEHGRKKGLPKPYYIMFVSDAAILEGELITKYIHEGQEQIGLTTLIMAENYEQLPNLCEYVLQKDEAFQGCYGSTDAFKCQVRFDQVHAVEMEALARRLAGIEINETEKGGDIPNSLTFFEMFHVGHPDELKAEERWRKNRNYENMKAEVGVKAGGEICYLDVHEKYHGPHGLVAGTTGSGKSETLQTYMLSLALNFSPDDINFFVIDYKGGGMANLFDGLPHLIGQISNLSGNQVRRAMVSIKSENKRRQRVFNEHNVNNINLYTKLYKNGEASIPVPHLFIVIDEFAELKREEGDFMKELISVAQVGRSLGVHLILATQKPSGTVDDNIWSNSKFRLCLRVQDRQDSNDMLHKPDAAYITQAGRCYLQVGNDELYELFQSGYSGAPYDEHTGNLNAELASMISLNGKAALIGSKLRRKQQARQRYTWILNLIQIMQQVAADRSQSLAGLAENSDRMRAVYDKLAYFEIDYQESDYNSRRIDELLQAYLAIEQLTGQDGEAVSLEQNITELLKYVDSNQVKLPEQKVKTQLDAMVEYLARTARDHGYHHNFQLWMPLLPTSFALERLDGYNDHIFNGTRWPQEQEEWSLEVPIGLCDDPVSQAQMPLVLSFSENGHHAFCGMIVSGKSTLLQTLIYSLIHKYSPDYLNIYAIDFSSHMLAGFEQTPHVGGVIFEDDTEKMDKFFHMIEEMLDKRKRLFKGGNYSQYVRANGVQVPAVIVAVDNYANFREKTDNKYEEMMMHLAHDGVGYGVFLAITAGGFGSTEIQTKIGDNIKTVVCLQMNDKFQYADAMRVTRIELLPETNISGRGLAKVGERILEFQTALAVEAPDDYKRMEHIAAVCQQMHDAWDGKRARQIPIIPEKPIWSEFAALQEATDLFEDDRHLPVGYDMESASAFGIDLSRIYCYLISGRARTGKTNMLKVLIRSVHKKGGRICIIEHGSDELLPTANVVGAEYITSQKEQGEFFQRMIEPFQKRSQIKKSLVAEGREDDIYEALLAQEKYYIFIADLTAFIDSVYQPEEGALNIRPFLENITEKGKMHNVYMFAAVNPDTVSSVIGLRSCQNMTGYRTGMHFGGNVSNLKYMDFSNMNYTEQNKGMKAGIALLPLDNDELVSQVVIPIVKG